MTDADKISAFDALAAAPRLESAEGDAESDAADGPVMSELSELYDLTDLPDALDDAEAFPTRRRSKRRPMVDHARRAA